MHKQTENKTLIKQKKANTRLQDGPVFHTYKPNTEKVKASVLYRGAIEWNALNANLRNLDFEHFKSHQKHELVSIYKNC